MSAQEVSELAASPVDSQQSLEPLQNGDEAAESPSLENGGAKAAAERQSRLYIVKMPRPVDVAEDPYLEQQVENIRAQMRMLNKAFDFQKIQKEEARSKTQDAITHLRICRTELNEKMETLKPLRTAQQAVRNAQAAGGRAGPYADLEARTEAELDAKLAATEHRISHESNTLTEEKKLIAAMKKLEASRPRVRELAQKNALLEGVKEQAKAWEGNKETLEAELAVLRTERERLEGLAKGLQEAEAEVDAKLKELAGERRAVREQLDQYVAKQQEARKESRAKWSVYKANRDTAQTARALVKEGRLEDARLLCQQQVEEALAQLQGDAAFRTEYFELMEGQRKHAVSKADDAPQPAAGLANGKHGKAGPERAQTGVEKARQVIAEALLSARSQVEAKQQRDRSASLPTPAGKTMPEPIPSVVGPTFVPGANEEALRPAPKARRPPKAAKVQLPVLVHEEFVPPPTALPQRQEEERAEEKAARARERNAAAAEEARAKAERKKKAEEKRKRQAAEKKSAAIAAAVAAAEAESAKPIALALPSPEEAGKAGPDSPQDVRQFPSSPKKAAKPAPFKKRLPGVGAPVARSRALVAPRRKGLQRFNPIHWPKDQRRKLLIALFVLTIVGLLVYLFAH